ncbi:PDZ and LIM domain protein Zasp isoform X7 [Bombus vosnesenskii]|uniref:PDZ and LIM domain protein Zasp isoform X7 n=2 Tax=Pyrobombus TaxID=144703 RepID=A0A6J3KFG0_9HYME|nr:PDZ and LIM domain protein Zasp isoform X7 [Bombus vancouverensis nearcticus]XP_033307600.1 PDZ and LIM domain protein Zasp isoform X7 [Bombus bifarius]XP_033351615.1 PDZ and LIM domain protein Zasp isoform X7 [Bombus vosnesenskii]XP_050475783.1 PDZ and LIM domain protein Zasp isoform X7 [Bombus huntii]
MAQLINVKLSRFDGSPWGFRLQGGKDFGTPLVVQKVNTGSPAEAAGLKAGDAVIRVNNTEMYNLRHKDAQDVIVRAGNNFELTIQRGGSTWKPHVSPISSALPSPSPTAGLGNIAPVTKTSLAAKKQDGSHIGSGHNFSPKPFLNGTGDGSIKSIVNKQYNSPVGIYSEETIAETLSAQAEVLAGGVLGVNFKKNEKNYNAENSEVFKMVQEADKEPKTPEPVPPRTEFYSSVSHAVGGRATSPRSPTPLFHALHGIPAVNYNESPSSKRQVQRQESSSSSPASSVVRCSNCDRVLVGVFVRIKDKNLHVECFKCSTCGTSLKNVGYYNINNKLYCDIHAKLVARQNAPAGMVPITIPPGGKAPASTISAALANAPLSPPLSNHASSPQPFSAPASNNLIGPKPFGGSSTTISSPPLANTGNSTLPRPQSQTVTGTGVGGLGGAGSKSGTFAGSSAPKRGRGILNQATGPGSRLPLCAYCNSYVRGPFITALGQIWCPDHFVCVNTQCRRPLQDIGFVEEKGQLYCEYCFERFIAPSCNRCNNKIKGDCLNAIGKHFHPECFKCSYCGKLFGNSQFFLEEGLPYCEADWNELFTTKCFACGFPVEAGDRWVEALNNNYHSQCFNCTMCKKNLEGQSFYAKGGRPFCKNHAR